VFSIEFIVVHRKANLPKVVGAHTATSRLARSLYGREQQTNQDPNDRNNNKQFDERERSMGTRS